MSICIFHARTEKKNGWAIIGYTARSLGVRESESVIDSLNFFWSGRSSQSFHDESHTEITSHFSIKTSWFNIIWVPMTQGGFLTTKRMVSQERDRKALLNTPQLVYQTDEDNGCRGRRWAKAHIKDLEAMMIQHPLNSALTAIRLSFEIQALVREPIWGC